MYRIFSPNKRNIQKSDYRSRLQLFIISLCFSFGGLLFTFINIFTKEYLLAVFSLSFTLVSVSTSLFAAFSKKYFKIVSYIFLIIIFGMFSYFLYFGGTKDGYSTYWLLLFPFCTMIVYGWVVGAISSGAMLLEIVTFNIIHLVKPEILPYIHPMPSFYNRFLITYLAASALAFIFEFIKEAAFKSNEHLIEKALDNANKDTLTGLKNRNWLSYYLREHKTGFDSSVGVMMIDVDNFKQANDTYGHFFGDKVLSEVSKILLDVKCSHAVRWGGDEFILICENCDYGKYKEIAETIRTAANEIKFENDDQFTLSLSIGVAVCGKDDNIPLEELIDVADKQANLAKSRGKNSVFSIFCGK